MELQTSGFFAHNGNIKDIAQSHLSPTDRGLIFGEALSESICAFGKSLIDFDDHWERLESALHDIEWSNPPSKKDILFTLQSMLEKFPDRQKIQVRLLVTPGEKICNTYLYVFEAPKFPNEWFKEGIRVKRKALGYTHRLSRFKTNSYFETKRTLAQLKNNFEDLIWSNADQEITEGSFSNIFFIGRQGNKVEIVTPPETSGIIPGVTRKRILTLLQQAKIKADIATVFVDELPRFDEAFLCSSIRGLVPIRLIDQQQFFTARDTSVFRQIERLYSSYLKSITNL